MAGTGDRFWPIITIVFLVVDVALFSVTIRQRTDLNKSKSMLIERQCQIDEITNDCIEVDQSLIKSLLNEVGVFRHPSPMLFMIIPSYPCSACLDREAILFKNFCGSESVRCNILVRDFRLKDAKALFSNATNVSLYPFSIETLNDRYWQESEKIIYFLLNEDSVTNIMVASKYSGKASEHYFEHVSKLYGKSSD